MIQINDMDISIDATNSSLQDSEDWNVDPVNEDNPQTLLLLGDKVIEPEFSEALDKLDNSKFNKKLLDSLFSDLDKPKSCRMDIESVKSVQPEIQSRLLSKWCSRTYFYLKKPQKPFILSANVGLLNQFNQQLVEQLRLTETNQVFQPQLNQVPQELETSGSNRGLNLNRNVLHSATNLQAIFEKNAHVYRDYKKPIFCLKSSKNHSQNVYRFFEGLKIFYNLYNSFYVHRELYLEGCSNSYERILHYYIKKNNLNNTYLTYYKRKLLKHNANYISLTKNMQEQAQLKKYIQLMLYNLVQISTFRLLNNIQLLQKKQTKKEFAQKTTYFKTKKLVDFWVIILECIPTFNTLILELLGEIKYKKKLFNSLKTILKFYPDAFVDAFEIVFNADLAKCESLLSLSNVKAKKTDRSDSVRFRKTLFANKNSHEKEVLSPSNLTPIFELVGLAGFVRYKASVQKTLNTLTKEIRVYKKELTQITAKLNQENQKANKKVLQKKLNVVTKYILNLKKQEKSLLKNSKPNPNRKTQDTLNNIFSFYITKRNSWLILNDYLYFTPTELKTYYSKFSTLSLLQNLETSSSIAQRAFRTGFSRKYDNLGVNLNLEKVFYQDFVQIEELQVLFKQKDKATFNELEITLTDICRFSFNVKCLNSEEKSKLK